MYLSVFRLLVFIFLIKLNIADIYLHNPRGSNNRLNEANRERNNANRMFDSQNNNRGGYNVGGLYYISGSRLQIEWTNQHGCANRNTECDIILQYMCNNSLRDGTVTTTIPENNLNCENNECAEDRKYGMHEDYDYYKRCSTRQRNNGLFVADQILKGKTSRFTRQNPNGQRSGYECPEERDYYPYWSSSPWIDIAILTNRVARCPYYQTQSQNVLSRWECRLPPAVMERVPAGTPVPVDRVACEAFRVAPLVGSNDSVVYGRWIEISAHGVVAPECREAEWTRDNHLGNTLGGEMPTYNWTLPTSFTHESCALRLRYNISSTDYTAWNSNDNTSVVPLDSRAASNDLAQRHGFKDSTAAALRGYQWKGNPLVKPFPAAVDLSLQLAVNTAQISRVFQDRSHTFAIRDRPEKMDGRATIHQLNVRGKRGNIVQVFPAVEYDFVPNTLQMTKGDYLHVQWTGSNSNDQQLDGQGLAGTDRSNLLLLANRAYWNPAAEGRQNELGAWARAYPFQYSAAGLDDNSTLLQLTSLDLSRLALSSTAVGIFLGDMSELDDSAPYFDLGARKITRTGVFHTLCSRNNNFSNRNHKGRIICGLTRSEIFALGANGGEARLQDGSLILSIAPGTFTSLQKIQITRTPLLEAKRVLQMRGSGEMSAGRDYASDFYTLEFSRQGYTKTASMKVMLQLDSAADESGIMLYRADASSLSNWERVNVEVENQNTSGYVTFNTVLDGVYVARSPSSNIGWLVGLVIGLLVLVALTVGTVLYLRRNPTAMSSFSSRLRYLKRSTASNV